MRQMCAFAIWAEMYKIYGPGGLTGGTVTGLSRSQRRESGSPPNDGSAFDMATPFITGDPYVAMRIGRRPADAPVFRDEYVIRLPAFALPDYLSLSVGARSAP